MESEVNCNASLAKEEGGPLPSDADTCYVYVEQELKAMGLPSLLSTDNSEVKARAVSALCKILQLNRHNLKVMDELRDSASRDKSDVILQREAQARLKEDLRCGERERGLVEDRERVLIEKVKVLTSKLRAEQDEVRRLKVSMQYKETQRNHENKKREKEFERMKEKLGQLVSDKGHERRLGVSMLNSLHRSDGKRKTWNKPGSGDEDMYRGIISNYEERQKELILENASVRESLAGMERQLVGLLNEKRSILKIDSKGQGTSDKEVGEGDVAHSISTGHFQMPYDIVRDGIEQSLRDKCDLLKDHIDDLKLQIERLEASSKIQVDLKQDISLCSDDAMCILNERSNPSLVDEAQDGQPVCTITNMHHNS